MKLSIFLPFIVSFMHGCYGMPMIGNVGDTSKIYNEVQLGKVGRACLFPVIIIVDENNYSYSQPITDSLRLLLDKVKLFTLVPSDSVSVAMKEYQTSDSLFMKKVAKSLNADSFIKTGILYGHPPGYPRTHAATCIINVFDTQTGELLMECSFDTGIGKNYWTKAPSLQQVTSDAMIEVIQVLSKEIKKSRKLAVSNTN